MGVSLSECYRLNVPNAHFFATQLMKRIFTSLRRCYEDADESLRWAVLTLLCVLFIAALLFGASCATSPAGLSREHALYVAGTNVVGTLQTLVPYMPPPVGSTFEVVLAAATAALAAWNTHQGKRLRRLENGHGNGKTLGPPTSTREGDAR